MTEEALQFPGSASYSIETKWLDEVKLEVSSVLKPNHSHIARLLTVHWTLISHFRARPTLGPGEPTYLSLLPL